MKIADVSPEHLKILLLIVLVIAGYHHDSILAVL